MRARALSPTPCHATDRHWQGHLVHESQTRTHAVVTSQLYLFTSRFTLLCTQVYMMGDAQDKERQAFRSPTWIRVIPKGEHISSVACSDNRGYALSDAGRVYRYCTCQYLCPVCLSVCVSVCLPACLPACLYHRHCTRHYLCLVCLSVSLSVCLTHRYCTCQYLYNAGAFLGLAWE
jgi:hypothetical protein